MISGGLFVPRTGLTRAAATRARPARRRLLSNSVCGSDEQAMPPDAPFSPSESVR